MQYQCRPSHTAAASTRNRLPALLLLSLSYTRTHVYFSSLSAVSLSPYRLRLRLRGAYYRRRLCRSVCVYSSLLLLLYIYCTHTRSAYTIIKIIIQLFCRARLAGYKKKKKTPTRRPRRRLYMCRLLIVFLLNKTNITSRTCRE